MSTSPFHGYEQRECGEHSTTGARAWCIDCHQWCSPETPCPRCELPRLRAELAAGSGKLDRALAAAQELQDQLRAAVNALPEALHRQVMADREPLDLDDAVLDLAEQRNEARLALDLMTAERDGYRDQLSADWQAKQIHDLMAAAGRAHEERDEARAALARVREYVGGELVFTNAEMSALADCCDDHYEECAAVWRGYFLRVVLAALDGSGT